MLERGPGLNGRQRCPGQGLGVISLALSLALSLLLTEKEENLSFVCLTVPMSSSPFTKQTRGKKSPGTAPKGMSLLTCLTLLFDVSACFLVNYSWTRFC